ncbi:unnamed protein product [Ilex paraguariensis]|uniref:Uncharacterized protein n=1 Tax=Ilex paraguariensis TaxID=185542 RepID=A0ABC8SWJ9_9AQUA
MKVSGNLLLFTFFNLFLLATLVNGSNDDERKPYIVYMGELPEDTTSLVDEHDSLLSEAIGDVSKAKEHKIHSYGRSFNGFVARLLPHEANRLSQKESVVSVFPNTILKLHTTRSWDFLGMPETVKRNRAVESNLIVGLLDTGIWPESASFNDQGYGPAPHKWRGKCAKGANFTGCNNKVIGAAYYNLDPGPWEWEPTPVDTDGHGTHTSSTAAGRAVKGASLCGFAEGTARGGVPSARVAMYKVCWAIGCSTMDLLAGFDAAIADGVDVISVSIGGPSFNYFEDVIAIGAFHSMKMGILTSCAAGNQGPASYTVENTAPWIFTVGASSIDRQFHTAIKFGNGMKTTGMSLNTFSPKKQMYPLTSGAQAANATARIYGNASTCDWGTMLEKKVKGKIVYCIEGNGADYTINDMHGVGTIMSTDLYPDVPFSFLIPAALVSVKEGEEIDKYINSTKRAKAVIYRSKTVKMAAPFVVSFSSRGPQTISLNILKPDIVAPGLSILAAFSQMTTVTGYDDDKRIVKYNIQSGTSMSCPHAAAAAAYIKTFRPKWSPAAIKSALMTTATPMKIKTVDVELAYGSGQINPTRALHPGLVYDINMDSYISFLCKEGYNSTLIGLVTGSKKKYNCSTLPHAMGTDGLNYPSMHLQLTKPESTSFSAVFYRTVTNVESRRSVYKAKVKSPEGLSVTVIPMTMAFEKPYQQRSFKVVVKGKFIKNAKRLSASLEWSDSKHRVRSPILIYRTPHSR